MKKICAIILVLLLLVGMLTGCYKTGDDYLSGRFLVYKVDGIETIVVDSETGVMYWTVESVYKYGITPLYNADGSLMVYDLQADPLDIIHD